MYAWYSTFTLARTTVSLCQVTLRTSTFRGTGVPSGRTPVLRMEPPPLKFDTVTDSALVTGLPPAVSVIVMSNLTFRGVAPDAGTAGGAGTAWGGTAPLAGAAGRACPGRDAAGAAGGAGAGCAAGAAGGA